MTPEQKLKHAIILHDQGARRRYGETVDAQEITVHNVDALFEAGNEDWDLQDSLNEVREGEVETKLPCQSSRHYESKSVAAKMPDGTWVGWTYWYGGGKHGEPEAVDWIEYAYDLDVTERQETVTVRTYAMKQTGEIEGATAS